MAGALADVAWVLRSMLTLWPSLRLEPSPVGVGSVLALAEWSGRCLAKRPGPQRLECQRHGSSFEMCTASLSRCMLQLVIAPNLGSSPPQGICSRAAVLGAGYIHIPSISLCTDSIASGSCSGPATPHCSCALLIMSGIWLLEASLGLLAI